MFVNMRYGFLFSSVCWSSLLFQEIAILIKFPNAKAFLMAETWDDPLSRAAASCGWQTKKEEGHPEAVTDLSQHSAKVRDTSWLQVDSTQKHLRRVGPWKEKRHHQILTQMRAAYWTCPLFVT
ncbi:hypothetical protein AV530_000511 [Patagioenas fasciata monilis]|uniref:Uncharacterized protein n=1 Tax=Patagioenas fasciata monilis TaxID=372326 RepID=A0A1V4IFI4_PATFA|nr:hypothetical protein AV530_000511 [Patagioenas fasciata monilis]